MKHISETLTVIDITDGKHTKLPHGRFADYSRYEIIQHRYGGIASHNEGGSNFLEMLEIKNPPKGKCRYIVYEKSPRECFTEWRTLQYAIDAYDSLFNDPRLTSLEQRKGFISLVQCGDQTPWFYALEGQTLIGNYAFLIK